MYIVLGMIIAYFVLLIANKRKAKKYLKFITNKYAWIALASFVAGVATDLAGFPDSFLYDQFLEVVVAFVLCIPFHSMLKKHFKKEEENKQKMKETDEVEFDANSKERSKIVREFNEKYGLNLTDSQIDSIVDGSFQNKEWEKEIIAMDAKYTSINEWFRGETGWLRVYLKAFSVQNITSDFAYQKEICLSNFDEIFSSVDMDSFSSVDECVYAINNRYYTNFEESGFMVAYRFLQQNGKRYTLLKTGVVKAKTDLERLAEKYDNLSAGNQAIQNPNSMPMQQTMSNPNKMPMQQTMSNANRM